MSRDTAHSATENIYLKHNYPTLIKAWTVLFVAPRLQISRYIEIFQSKRMDYYSAIVGQLQSQVIKE